MIKRVFAIFLLIGVLFAVSGCYNKVVDQNSVGIEYIDGVMTGLKAPGRQRSNNRKASLEVYDGNTKSVVYTDSDIWTSDKQTFTGEFTVYYARNTQEANVRRMLRYYSVEAVSDAALEKLVLSKVPEAVKGTTTQYTIAEMVGLGDDQSKNRETLKQDIMTLLKQSLEACGIDLIDLTVDNIAPPEAYVAEMQQKSMLSQKKETEEQQQLLDMARISREKETKQSEMNIQIENAQKQIEVLEAQKELEKAQTELAIEKARRDNLVEQEKAKVLAQSPEAFELARLELLAGMLKSTDKVYFIPEGADITLFLDSAKAVGVE